MKTREQIYGQEAAGILRDVSMYRALTEMQLLKLYPHKESKIPKSAVLPAKAGPHCAARRVLPHSR